MIRVNLLRDVSETVVKKGAASTAAASGGISLKPQTNISESLGVLIKLIVLFVPVVGLFLFEQYNIESLNAEKNAEQQRLNQLKVEYDQVKLEAEAIKRFNEEKAKLAARVQTIRDLSSERLLVIKALESLQNVMPERVWVTKISFSGNSVKIEGNAIEEIDVSLLMEELEKSVFFQSIALQGTNSVKSPEGVIKAFKMTAMLEVGAGG